MVQFWMIWGTRILGNFRIEETDGWQPWCEWRNTWLFSGGHQATNPSEFSANPMVAVLFPKVAASLIILYILSDFLAPKIWQNHSARSGLIKPSVGFICYWHPKRSSVVKSSSWIQRLTVSFYQFTPIRNDIPLKLKIYPLDSWHSHGWPWYQCT